MILTIGKISLKFKCLIEKKTFTININSTTAVWKADIKLIILVDTQKKTYLASFVQNMDFVVDSWQQHLGLFC